ncbi:hypothetical protein [Putridiphycobacter roseus]|nr:hypothetical protein [Putridiphycobacter roseus]
MSKLLVGVLLLALGPWSTLSAADIEKPDWLKNRRKKHPFGLNVGILGPTGWGFVSADYFIDSKLDLEGGMGIQTNGIHPYSFFAGAKYHLAGKFIMGSTFYFGAMDAFFFKDGKGYQHNLYFPIGIHKIKRNKFSWSLEVAYQFNKNSDSNIWGAFKVGYRIF